DVVQIEHSRIDVTLVAFAVDVAYVPIPGGASELQCADDVRSVVETRGVRIEHPRSHFDRAPGQQDQIRVRVQRESKRVIRIIRRDAGVDIVRGKEQRHWRIQLRGFPVGIRHRLGEDEVISEIVVSLYEDAVRLYWRQ